MTTTFAQLGLPQPLVQSLTKRGIEEPFPVQSVTIPDALAGKDISGKAPTGSGKTLAFGLPLLTRVSKAKPRKPRALILAPTRELAEQIKLELGSLARAADRSIIAVYGGVSYVPQKKAFRNGVDILVATPGRLEDLISQDVVDLSSADIVVVDEADRMADMGFLPAVRRILDQTSNQRQTMLFSATLDGDIATLSKRYQKNPVRHDAPSVEPETSDAQHLFWGVEHDQRPQHTAQIVEASGRSIVFTRTRHGADRLARQLGKLGVGAVAMHGGRSQNQRNRALKEFSSGRAQALIATDVAARGIHIDAVASVVHFDPPADHKDYLHRSGRTARAGAPGTVVSLVTKDQRRTVGRMQRDLDFRIDIEEPSLTPLFETHFDLPTPPPATRTHSTPRSHQPRERSSERPSRNRNSRSKPQSEVEQQSVYVANLPWSHSKHDVQRLFERYGKVYKTSIITDKRNGKSKGLAFIDMPKPAAKTAIKALHGSSVNGRQIQVRFAQPRTYGKN
ncbi:MAG: DEAD/DEAH box helicase [Actinomycetota bacterium]